MSKPSPSSNNKTLSQIQAVLKLSSALDELLKVTPAAYTLSAKRLEAQDAIAYTLVLPANLPTELFGKTFLENST